MMRRINAKVNAKDAGRGRKGRGEVNAKDAGRGTRRIDAKNAEGTQRREEDAV
jgi:hypothetical protein